MRKTSGPFDSNDENDTDINTSAVTNLVKPNAEHNALMNILKDYM